MVLKFLSFHEGKGPVLQGAPYNWTGKWPQKKGNNMFHIMILKDKFS